MKTERGSSLYSLIATPAVGMFFLMITGLLAYSGTLDQPFHYDDIANIVDNPYVRDINKIPGLFIEIKGPAIAVRPLTSGTFSLNYSISELDTTSYHYFNLAVHILNGILLYILLLKCVQRFQVDKHKGKIVAFITALLFIAHPIQTESVSYIVTRSMLLAAMFYFSGLIVFLLAIESGTKRWAFALAIGVLSLLGMASREDFVTFPPILLLFDYLLLSERSFKKVLSNIILHIPAWLGILYLVYLVMSYEYSGSGFGISEHKPYEYFITQFRVHWSYLRMLALPIGQNIDYDYPVAASVLETRTLMAFIGYVGLWMGGIWLVRKNPVISFLILWFMITLTPASSIVPLNDVIFEHRLYIASAGVFVVFSLLICRLQNKFVLGTVVSLLSMVLILSTYSRNLVWETKASLWEDSVMKSPDKPRPHYSLGTMYIDMEQTDLAISELTRALELRPIYPEASNNLGFALMNNNQLDLAIQHYLNAIKASSTNYFAYSNLSKALQLKGDYEESILWAEKALELSPGYVVALNNIAMSYLLKGDAARAIYFLKKSVRINPLQSERYEDLAAAYNKLGKSDYADEALMRAKELIEKGN